MRQPTLSFNPELDEEFESELRDLGREHARVFALVGKFINLVRAGAEASWLLVLLERIIMLILAHCQTEESLLRRQGHPALVTQSEAHRLILGELEHFHDGLLTGQNLLTNEYIHLFDSLIVHHLRDDPGCDDVSELTDWLTAGP